MVTVLPRLYQVGRDMPALLRWTSAIMIVFLGIRGRLGPDISVLALTVLLALVANAAIAGIFSNPVDRYQSRLIWPALLVVFIAMGCPPRTEGELKPSARVRASFA